MKKKITTKQLYEIFNAADEVVESHKNNGFVADSIEALTETLERITGKSWEKRWGINISRMDGINNGKQQEQI